MERFWWGTVDLPLTIEEINAAHNSGTWKDKFSIHAIRGLLNCMTPDCRYELAVRLGLKEDTYGRSKSDMVDLLIGAVAVIEQQASQEMARALEQDGD
jgi:hypothetical protein